MLLFDSERFTILQLDLPETRPIVQQTQNNSLRLPLISSSFLHRFFDVVIDLETVMSEEFMQTESTEIRLMTSVEFCDPVILPKCSISDSYHR